MINITCKSFRIYPCTPSSRSQYDGNGFRWLRPLSLWLLFLGFYQPAFAILRCEFGTGWTRRGDTCDSIIRSQFTNEGSAGSGYALFSKVNAGRGPVCGDIGRPPHPQSGYGYCLPYKDPKTGLLASFKFTTLTSTPVAVPAHKLIEAKALIGKSNVPSGAKNGYQRLSALCTRYGGKRVQECMTHSKGLMDQVLMFPKMFGLCIAPYIPRTDIPAPRGMSSFNISNSLPADEGLSGASPKPFTYMGKYFDPNAADFEDQDTEVDFNAMAAKPKCPGNRFVLAANQAFNTWAASWRLESFPAGTTAPGVRLEKSARARLAALVSPFSSTGALTADPDELFASAAQATLNDPLYGPQIAAGIDPSVTPRSSDEPDEPDEPDDSRRLSRLDASARAAATALKKDKAITNYFRKVASVPRNLVLNAILGTNAAVPTVPARVSERELLWQSRMLQQVKDMSGGNYQPTFVGGASVGIYARLGLKYEKPVEINGVPIPLNVQGRVATTIFSCAPVVGCENIVSKLRQGIITQTIQVEVGANIEDTPGVGRWLKNYGIGAGIGAEVDIGLTEHLDAWSDARVDFVTVQANGDVSNFVGPLAKIGQAFITRNAPGFNNFAEQVTTFTKKSGDDWMSFIEPGPGSTNIPHLLAAGLTHAGLATAKGANYLFREKGKDFSLVEINPFKLSIMNPNFVNQVVDKTTPFMPGWDKSSWAYIGLTAGLQGHFGHRWEGTSDASVWGGKFSINFQIYTIVKGELGAAFSANGKKGIFGVLARASGG